MEFFLPLIFYLLIFLVFYKYKHKVKRYGFIFLLELSKGEFIDKFVQNHKKFLKYLSYAVNIIGFLGMLFSVFYVIKGIVDYIFYKNTVFKILPVIPGIRIGGYYFPFIETVVAIFIAAFVHEIFHAIFIRYYNIRLKGLGIALIGPFLAAYTEPDENQLKNSDKKIIRTIAFAGPFGNILLSLLIFPLFFLPVNFIKFEGLKIINVTKGSPAEILPINATIIGINNYTIKTIQDFKEIFYRFKPGEKITIITDKGNFTVILGNKSGKPWLGVLLEQKYEITNYFLYYLYRILRMIFVISLGIGIANLLPIFILDGGIVLSTLVNKRLYKILSTIVLLLVIINLILSL